jgi:hypothetical protein
VADLPSRRVVLFAVPVVISNHDVRAPPMVPAPVGNAGNQISARFGNMELAQTAPTSRVSTIGTRESFFIRESKE